MGSTSLAELSRRDQQRAVTRSVLRIAASTVGLTALYYVLPAVGRGGVGATTELVIGLVALAALVAWQVRSIMGARHPELRAAEALAVAVGLLIFLFAFTYLSISHADPAAFSQRLDHTASLYFTVITLGTVGYGDIVARSDLTRLLVAVQILLDLGVLVAIVRTIIYAARLGVRRQQLESAREMPADQS
jgi:voltage-gated potassium channel Kch